MCVCVVCQIELRALYENCDYVIMAHKYVILTMAVMVLYLFIEHMNVKML